MHCVGDQSFDVLFDQFFLQLSPSAICTFKEMFLPRAPETIAINRISVYDWYKRCQIGTQAAINCGQSNITEIDISHSTIITRMDRNICM